MKHDSMNHVSEWMKVFHECARRYRYEHKVSGVVRDTLMAIGQTFARTVTRSLKKAVEKAAAQAAEKVTTQAAAKVAEKGGKNIQYLLRARQRAPSADTMLQLSQILANCLGTPG